VRTKDSGTYNVLVNLWLTLYKLTGWPATLDLHQPYTRRILSHRKVFPYALFGVLGLDVGRGKTINNLVDRDREVPANTLNKKDKDLDHARAMDRDCTRVGGSTDALSSYV